MNQKISYFLILISIFINLQGITIDRVILASDTKPLYLDFWPLVAQAWQKMGIRPTLALIEDRPAEIDETIGDVIRFKPIKGIPSGFQAMVIRLFLPFFFEDEVSITSDIDILPLSKKYFVDRVKKYDDDCFIVYRDDVYPGNNRYPMCYTAAKGKLYKEIFNLKTVEDIEKRIIEWAKLLNLKLSTDEEMLAKCLHEWEHYEEKCIRLKDLLPGRRIDRSDWKYDINLLNNEYYIDSHMLRPYQAFKSEINTLARSIGLEVVDDQIDQEGKIILYGAIIATILLITLCLLTAICFRKKRKIKKN